MKKSKIKTEEVALNFRVSKELKDKIIRASEVRNITLSKYLRETLNRVHDSAFSEEYEAKSEKEQFLLSQRLFKLVIWLYSKRFDQKRVESDMEIDEFIKTIKKADVYMPLNLNNEFDKVLADLLRIKTAKDYEKDHYYFTKSYEKEKEIDFEILNKFFLTQEFDNYLNKAKGYIMM